MAGFELAMIRVRLYDTIFAHATAMGNGNLGIQPESLIWDRETEDLQTAVFTDNSLAEVDRCNSRYKIALLMESPEVFPLPYDQIRHSYHKFSAVLTFDKDLFEFLDFKNYIPRFIYPLGGCWIKRPWMHEKTKLVSMIISDKRTAPGHLLRHEIAKRFPQIDVFGRGIRPIQDKEDGLLDYMFSIVVENCRKDYYFTEKLVDCFATGTVPIFWGCPSIHRWFNPGGIIAFDSIQCLEGILKDLNRDTYRKMIPLIRVNYCQCSDFFQPEKHIAKIIRLVTEGKLDG